jgi:AcrR family transcriptional regulator
MATRTELSAVRKAAVLRAAAEILDELGVEGMTIRAVAKRAGVASGTVFLYAENKADLVNQVYGIRISNRWRAALDDLVPLPPLARVEAFFLRCVDIFFDDRENVLAFYMSMAANGTLQAGPVPDLLEDIRLILDDAQSRGEISQAVDITVLWYSYQGLFGNVITLALRGFDRLETKRVVKESMALLRIAVVDRLPTAGLGSRG